MIGFVFECFRSDRGEIDLVAQFEFRQRKIDIVDEREGKHRIEISEDGSWLARLGLQAQLLFWETAIL